jgi:hypothetical protein
MQLSADRKEPLPGQLTVLASSNKRFAYKMASQSAIEEGLVAAT